MSKGFLEKDVQMNVVVRFLVSVGVLVGITPVAGFSQVLRSVEVGVALRAGRSWPSSAASCESERAATRIASALVTHQQSSD